MSKYGNDILFAAVIQPKKLLGKPRHSPSLQTFPSFAQCPAAWRDPPSPKHAAGSKGPHSHGSLSQTGGFLARRLKKALSSTPLWQRPEGQQAYAAPVKKSRAHSTKVNRGSPAASQPAYSYWSLSVNTDFSSAGFLASWGRGRGIFLLCRATVWQKHLQPSQPWEGHHKSLALPLHSQSHMQFPSQVAALGSGSQEWQIITSNHSSCSLLSHHCYGQRQEKQWKKQALPGNAPAKLDQQQVLEGVQKGGHW